MMSSLHQTTFKLLRQTTLNLFAAGLFHLVEQRLADLCRDASFDVLPPRDTKLSVVTSWYGDHFLLELQKLPPWPTIDEMRLVANVVKHAEGRSAEDSRDVRPELFEFVRPVRMPLAGDDLYVTEDRFRIYGEAAHQFFADIATYFETHAGEYYPR